MESIREQLCLAAFGALLLHVLLQGIGWAGNGCHIAQILHIRVVVRQDCAGELVDFGQPGGAKAIEAASIPLQTDPECISAPEMKNPALWRGCGSSKSGMGARLSRRFCVIAAPMDDAM